MPWNCHAGWGEDLLISVPSNDKLKKTSGWVALCGAKNENTNDHIVLCFDLFHRTRAIDPDTGITTIVDVPKNALLVVELNGVHIE